MPPKKDDGEGEVGEEGEKSIAGRKKVPPSAGKKEPEKEKQSPEDADVEAEFNSILKRSPSTFPYCYSIQVPSTVYTNVGLFLQLSYFQKPTAPSAAKRNISYWKNTKSSPPPSSSSLTNMPKARNSRSC